MSFQNSPFHPTFLTELNRKQQDRAGEERIGAEGVAAGSTAPTGSCSIRSGKRKRVD